MAKGYAMERWQGKKGSNVFYKISNSSNAQKQGVRERVYEVSNPKTRSQAMQRMKVRAAQNFYNTLAPILNRAMQGVKYGGMTRNEFMRFALSMNSSPAVEKGSNVAIPGNYLLSKGSLPGFYAKSFESKLFGAPWGGEFQAQGALTSLDVEQITANGAIKVGDQITIICFDESFRFQYVSFIIERGSVLPSIMDGNIMLIGSSTENVIVLNGAKTITAGAVILSRKNGNKYERSTAYLELDENSTAIQNAYSTQAINAALATYQKSVSVNGESTDWPVEPEDDGQGSGVASISAPYVLSGLTGAKAGLNGRKVLVFENANTGNLTSVGVNNGYLVDFATYQTLIYQESGVHQGLKPSDVTALASLPTSEINAGI